MKKLFSTVMAFAWAQSLVYAKPIADAVRDEVDSQSLDAGGFRLMIICISLLFLLVVGLFAGTMYYFWKGKKKS